MCVFNRLSRNADVESLKSFLLKYSYNSFNKTISNTVLQSYGQYVIRVKQLFFHIFSFHLDLRGSRSGRHGKRGPFPEGFKLHSSIWTHSPNSVADFDHPLLLMQVAVRGKGRGGRGVRRDTLASVFIAFTPDSIRCE